MFTPHVDNDNDRPKSVIKAICLLTDTKTSMRVCGKEEFVYQNMGHIDIFPSAIFHETIFAEASTMKLAMFLRLTEKYKSLKTLSRTTRVQYKAVELPSPSLNWKLDKKLSSRAHKMENSHDSQGKITTVTLVNYLSLVKIQLENLFCQSNVDLRTTKPWRHTASEGKRMNIFRDFRK